MKNKNIGIISVSLFVIIAIIIAGSVFSAKTASASRLAPPPVVLIDQIFTVPADVSVEATSTLTYVDLGTPHWVNSDGSVYSGSLPIATNNAPAGNLFPVGDTSVIWQYQDLHSGATSTATSTQKVTVTNLLKSIAITTPASKLSYTVGDLLDITGLIVTGAYSNTSTSTISITTSDVSGFSSASPASGQVLTITSGGKTTTYTIDVVAAPVVSSGGGGGSGSYASPSVLQSLGLGVQSPAVVVSGQVLGAQTTGGKVLGASSFKFEGSLRKGIRSDAVKELQERLRSEGFFTYPTSTGYFGPITFAAVKAYQKAHGLPQTGLVGSMTRAILNQ